MKKAVAFGSILIVSMFLLIPSAQAINLNFQQNVRDKIDYHFGLSIQNILWCIIKGVYMYRAVRGVLWLFLSGFELLSPHDFKIDNPIFLIPMVICFGRAGIWLEFWTTVYGTFGWSQW